MIKGNDNTDAIHENPLQGLSVEKMIEVRRILKLLSRNSDIEGTHLDPFHQYYEELVEEQKRKRVEADKERKELKERGVIQESSGNVEEKSLEEMTVYEEEDQSTKSRDSVVMDYNKNVEGVIKSYLEATNQENLEANLEKFKLKVIEVEQSLSERMLNKQYTKENIDELRKDVNELSNSLVELSASIASLLRWYRSPVGSDRYRLGGIFIHDFNKPIKKIASLLSMITLVHDDDENEVIEQQVSLIQTFRTPSKETKTQFFKKFLYDLSEHMKVLTEFIEDEVNNDEPNFISFENIRKTLDLNGKVITLIDKNGNEVSNYKFATVDQWICVHTLLLNALSEKATEVRIQISLIDNVTSIGIYDNSKKDWPDKYKADVFTNFTLGYKYPEFPTTQSLRGGGMVGFLKGQEAGRLEKVSDEELPKLMGEYIGFEDPIDMGNGKIMKCIRVNFHN